MRNPRPVIRQGHPISTFPFNTELKALASSIRQEKQIERIQKGNEEAMLPLFAYNLLYTRKFPNYTRKPLKMMAKFSIVARYRINFHKSITFLYTNTNT